MSEAVLDVPLKNQELSLWCWAAIASALTAIVPGIEPLAPCRVASIVTLGTCCDRPDPCNDAQELDVVFDKVRIPFVASGPDVFESIRSAIEDNSNPVAARIEDDTGRGHFVLLVGCDAAAGTVVCADPYGPPGYPATRYRMSYADFQTRYGGWGRCTDLYFITAGA